MSKEKEIKKQIEELNYYNRALKFMSVIPSVLQSENDYLLICTFNNRTAIFEVISDNILQILGFHHSEVEGRVYRDFTLFDDETEEADKAVEDNLQNHIMIKKFDIWYRHKDGINAVLIRWDAAPVINDRTFCMGRVMDKKPIKSILK